MLPDMCRWLRSKPLKSNEVVELWQLLEPPKIDKCVGHWIMRINDNDREGLVHRVDRSSRTMSVQYDQSGDYTLVSYDEPALLWFSQEKHYEERKKNEPMPRIDSSPAPLADR